MLYGNSDNGIIKIMERGLLVINRIIAFFESVILTLTLFFSQLGAVFYLPAEKKVDALLAKTDGFIFGVCHPVDGEYDDLHELGAGWVRFDIPYPFNSDGSISSAYTSFRNRCRNYTENGFKVMAITPYPKSYFEAGFNPTAPENQQKTKDIAVFMLNDLREYIAGIQVTNEMGIEVFTYPLTLEEAAVFTGIQLEALNDVKGNIIVGYNTAGLNLDFHKMMKEYHKYCDYVGLDLYLDGSSYDYTKRMRKIYRLTKRPILIQEFGYKSAGEPKTQQEKTEILQQYGYNSEQEAAADIENFVSKLPSAFQQRIKENSSDPADWGTIVFDYYADHFYRQLGTDRYLDCAHTPEGQDEYFASLMPDLLREPYLAGLTVYCYRDSYSCWFCGFEGCPHETCWGLTDVNGGKKPSFYAVQKVIADYNNSHR